MNREFGHSRGSQRGLQPPYRGRGGTGNCEAESEKQGGLVNPDFNWRGRGGFRGRGGGFRGGDRGRGRGGGGQYGERQDSYGDSYDQYSRDEEEAYDEEYYSDQHGTRGRGRGRGHGRFGEGGRSTNGGEMNYSSYSEQAGEDYGGSTGESWSEEFNAANQGGDGYDGNYEQWQSDQAHESLEGEKFEGGKTKDQGFASDHEAKYSGEGESYASSHDPASLAKKALLRDDAPEEVGAQLDASRLSQSQYDESGVKLEDSKTSNKQSGPTISSLQKGGTTTVIPGLGSSDEPEETDKPEEKASSPEKEPPPPQPKEEQELKSSLKTQLLDVFSGAKAAKMVQSMERIVNQLQTLRGLESSLKVLQGDQSKEPAATTTPKPKTEVPEVDQEAAARKQVAALLATESDSDGEVCV